MAMGITFGNRHDAEDGINRLVSRFISHDSLA